MNNMGFCEIEALFGSRARGDSDELSDADYLLVDGSPERLSQRKEFLSRQGFSVSDYGVDRFLRLFQNQTLFSLHLAREAKIICDQAGLAADLFASAEMKTRYHSELFDSYRLFGALEIIPATAKGYGWALDQLSVAFRNSAILFLANEGEAVFSFEGITSALKRRGRLDAQSETALQRLRRAKREYRGGVVTPEAQIWAEEGIRAADSVLRLGLHAKNTRGPCLSINSPACDSTEAYLTLRAIERELVSTEGLTTSEEASWHRNQLLKMVSDPHQYLWKAIYRPEHLEEHLTKVRAGY